MGRHYGVFIVAFTENGKLYAQIHIGLTEKTIVIGEALGDDLWHSVKLERRGMVITLGIDDDRPLIGNNCALFSINTKWLFLSLHALYPLVYS